MTDIVIKPSNSGGSVKLQTEGGTNGLTMASTGDLTTSGNVAVTGTVTGGTLGTGVTFPAGHVLQVFHKQTSNLQTISGYTWTVIGGSGTTGGGFDEGLETSFTPKSANSKLILQFKVEIGRTTNTGGSGNGGHIAWCLDGTPINVPNWGTMDRTMAHSGTASDSEELDIHNTHSVFGMTYYDAYTTTDALALSVRGIFRDNASTENFLVNYSLNDANGTYSGRYVSNMLIMEVEQ